MAKEKIIEGTVRFTVTVEYDAFNTLQKYCERLGATKSTVINGMLVEATDAMEGLMALMDKAEAGEVGLGQFEAELLRLEAILKRFDDKGGI